MVNAEHAEDQALWTTMRSVKLLFSPGGSLLGWRPASLPFIAE
jgi:hypothetical protein